MTISTSDESQRKAARIAGFTCLFTMAIVVFATFGVHAHLIVAGDVAETARNIIAHETMFRIGIACGLIYSVGLVVLLTALNVVLKPVNRGVALLAALWRFVYALMWVLMTINLYQGLRLLSGAEYARVFEAEQLHVLAKFYIGGFDVYYVGLVFYSLASTACSYLWFKSNYIPKVLAAFGVISSVFCVACTLAFIVFPGFAGVVNLWWFDSPMGLFEMALSFWLVFKGLRRSGIAEPGNRSDRAQTSAA
jgi:tetrahydromethanopterin S-methyltransferase subunit F